MKHIIKTDNYLLVVDKEHLVDMPKNINVYSGRYKNVIRFAEVENSYMNECFEIKAHLPLNNSPILEGVDLLPPLEDEVEKLVQEWVDKGEFTSGYSFRAGYNKAKETYKYTEEDLRKAIELARGIRDGKDTFDAEDISGCTEVCTYGWKYEHTEEEIIQSLQQPKLPIAFECEILVEFPVDWDGKGIELKKTTNSQGQTVLVGRYVYE